ncbi:MAG: hypothetical protein WC756_12195 [Taibaiella sp.]|jgi:hypothetical protein
MEQLTWTTEKRKVSDLVPYDLNPRLLTEDRRQRLVASLEKFNLAEIPAINLDHTVIAGNQRLAVMKAVGRGEEWIDVRVPNRQLTESEVKEYNLIANTHAGQWDFELLQQEFSEFDLKEFDITLPDPEFPPLGDHKGIEYNPDKKWFLNIECTGEQHAQRLYEELSNKGLEVKIIN